MMWISARTVIRIIHDILRHPVFSPTTTHYCHCYCYYYHDDDYDYYHYLLLLLLLLLLDRLCLS